MSQYVLFHICEGEVKIVNRQFQWARAKELLQEIVDDFVLNGAVATKEDWNEYTIDWSECEKQNSYPAGTLSKPTVLRLIRFESNNESTFYPRLKW